MAAKQHIMRCFGACTAVGWLLVAVAASLTMGGTAATCDYTAESAIPLQVKLSECTGNTVFIAQSTPINAVSILMDTNHAVVDVVDSDFAFGLGLTVVGTVRNTTVRVAASRFYGGGSGIVISGTFVGSAVVLQDTSSEGGLVRFSRDVHFANYSTLLVHNATCDAQHREFCLLSADALVATNHSSILINASRFAGGIRWWTVALDHYSGLRIQRLVAAVPDASPQSSDGTASIAWDVTTVTDHSTLSFDACSVTGTGTPLYFGVDGFVVSGSSRVDVRGGTFRSTKVGSSIYTKTLSMQSTSVFAVSGATFRAVKPPTTGGMVHVADATLSGGSVFVLDALDLLSTDGINIVVTPLLTVREGSAYRILNCTLASTGTFVPDAAVVGIVLWRIEGNSSVFIHDVAMDAQGAGVGGSDLRVVDGSNVTLSNIRFTTVFGMLALTNAVVTRHSVVLLSNTTGSSMYPSLFVNGSLTAAEWSSVWIRDSSWSTTFNVLVGIQPVVSLAVGHVTQRSALVMSGCRLMGSGAPSCIMRGGTVSSGSAIRLEANSIDHGVALSRSMSLRNDSVWEFSGNTLQGAAAPCVRGFDGAVVEMDLLSMVMFTSNACDSDAPWGVPLVRTLPAADSGSPATPRPASLLQRSGFASCNRCGPSSQDCGAVNGLTLLDCSDDAVSSCTATCQQGNASSSLWWTRCEGSCVCLSGSSLCYPMVGTASVTATMSHTLSLPCLRPLPQVMQGYLSRVNANTYSVYAAPLRLDVPLGIAVHDISALVGINSSWGHVTALGVVSNGAVASATSSLQLTLSPPGGRSTFDDAVVVVVVVDMTWAPSATANNMCYERVRGLRLTLGAAPLPTPLAARTAAQAAATAALLTAAVVPGASLLSAAALQRSMLVLRLSACQFVNDSPPPISDSPLQLSLGDGDASYDRGALAGNAMLVVCFVGATCAAATVTTCRARPHHEGGQGARGPWCTAWAHRYAMPGKVVAVVLALLQPTLAASFRLLATRTAGDVAAAAACLLAATAYVAHVAWHLVLRFPLTATVRRYGMERGCVRRLFDNEVDWDPSSSAAVRRRQRMSLWPDAAPPSQHAHRIAFFHRYAAWFDGYTLCRHWYLVVELGVAIVAGVLEAQEPQSQSGCTAVSGVLLALSVGLLGLQGWLRQFNNRWDAACAARDNGLLALCAALLLLDAPTAADVVAMLHVYASFSVTVIPLVVDAVRSRSQPKQLTTMDSSSSLSASTMASTHSSHPVSPSRGNTADNAAQVGSGPHTPMHSAEQLRQLEQLVRLVCAQQQQPTDGPSA